MNVLKELVDFNLENSVGTEEGKEVGTSPSGSNGVRRQWIVIEDTVGV